jgi:flavin-dependent dehydrogenase
MAMQLKRNDGHLRDYWRKFTAKLKARGLVDYDDYDPRGYSYYLRGEVDIVSDSNAYIVGDAVGLATRDMCEGIGPAIRSSLLTAHSIVTGEPYSLTGIGTLSGAGYASRLLERQFAQH